MDPSQNNSFGGNTGFSVPQPVISSGSGDIVLGGGEKKSKKRLIVVLAVVVLVVAGLLVAVFFGLSKNRVPESEAREYLGVLIAENQDNIFDLTKFVSEVYEGNVSLSGLSVGDEASYGKVASMLNDGIGGMKIIKEAIDSGKYVLSGVNNGIDLGENYSGLRSALEDYLPRYERLVELTLNILAISMGDDVEKRIEELSSFGAGGLAEVISDYIAAGEQYSEELVNNGCVEVMSEVCSTTIDALYNTMNEMSGASDVVQEAYVSVGGEMVVDGEGSIMYYLNNILAGVEEHSDE